MCVASSIFQYEFFSHSNVYLFRSCVAFGPQSRCMGVAARQQANTNVKNTIFNVKQLIGRKFSDPISKHFLEWIACDTVQSSDDSIGIMVMFGNLLRFRSLLTPTSFLFLRFFSYKSFDYAQELFLCDQSIVET